MGDEVIGCEIRVLSNLIHRWIENSPNKKRIDDATASNAWIIGFISDENARGRDVYQRDFERHFGITRSTASKVVNLMVQKGLIVRESVPEDARLKKLVLTERAYEVDALLNDDFALLEQTLSAGFSKEELAAFFDYMHRMQRNIKSSPAGAPPGSAL